MLFPGAVYVIISASWLVVMIICLALAFMVGSGTWYMVKFLVEHTNAYKRLQQGQKNANKWWFNFMGWAGTTMIISFIIFVYTIAGPYMAFIKYLGGL